MKQNFVQDSFFPFFVSNLGGGYAYNSESGFQFCHPDSAWQAATHHFLEEWWEEAGRKANLSELFPVSSSGKRVRKGGRTLRLKCNLGILHEFQIPTFSLSSISKENPVLALLLYKITQGFWGISAELPYQ